MKHTVGLFTAICISLCLVEADSSAQSTGDQAGSAGFQRPNQSFNPEMSAILDMFYTSASGDDTIRHIHDEIEGFGHSDSHGEHDHQETGNGFNLRHLELQFSAAVDPYFKAAAIVAIDVEGAEMEVAEIETTAMPFGLKLKGGKFFSDFGYINAKHAHEWDFTDQPLIYNLTLGSHGLNDKGLQLSWIAPTPFYLLTGFELFQGDNEKMFAYHGDGELPERDGPRLGVGWLKFAPNMSGAHALQFGLSAGSGIHQEEHDGSGDGEYDHWLDGDNSFRGADIVYKFNAPKPYGQGDFAFQAEYFSRKKDLEVVAHDIRPDFAGNRRVDKQDGYYAQAVYGFMPRLRAGIRWEAVGLQNSVSYPGGDKEEYGSSSRAGLMVDFTPSEFSRIRLQGNQGTYETEDGREEVFEVFVQWMISLGAHGAHKF